MRAKVTIVGAGMTGGTMAQRLAESGYADVVIITSGVPRKPGMSREELLSINAGIVRDVATAAVKHSPDAVFIIFANPMDAMCHVTLQTTGLPQNRVIGQGGMLDSARYRTFLAWAAGVSVQDVHAEVLGGHTEATMVPIVSTSTIGGVPITAILSKEQIDACVQRAKNGGAEIVALLKTGSAFYAPAAATVEMVEAILLDKNRVMPCAVLADGQYGIKGTFIGLPVRLGDGGAEQIYEPPLWDNEVEGIQAAAAATKELIALIEKK